MLSNVRAYIGEAGLSGSLDIKAYACLGHCQRPCRISIGGTARWSWLLGDLVPEALPLHLDVFFQRWLAASNGFLSRADRPMSLRTLLIGSVPPLVHADE